jgi:hypothetical protein
MTGVIARSTYLPLLEPAAPLVNSDLVYTWDASIIHLLYGALFPTKVSVSFGSRKASDDK